MTSRQGRVLVVAGSDSGGGAGLQADLKTLMALGAYGATAVTALTAQNTRGVQDVFPVPGEFVARQMSAVLEDIGADCIKTGMLFDAGVIEAVAEILDRQAAGVPLVLDPVMVAQSGDPLLHQDAVQALRQCLLPRATLLTPNVPEAELLSGLRIRDADDLPRVAARLMEAGCQAVLLKGGHLEGTTVTDLLVTSRGSEPLQWPRVNTTCDHGTGCTLASAIAAGLAQGMALGEAVRRARRYLQRALETALPLGGGRGPVNHAHCLGLSRS